MHQTKTQLTSAEIGALWAAYMNDTIGVCTLQYFFENVEDEDIKPLLKSALDLSKQHIKKIIKYLNEEGLPVPQGFTESDIVTNAPRLYVDPFYLFYLRNLAVLGMHAYSIALSNCARPDIRDYFTDCLSTSVKLFNNTTDTLQIKGLFVRAPIVEIPKQVSFVKKEEFLDDILGKKRPLLTVEVTHLYSNVLTNLIGRALLTGFGQVTSSKEVKDFMFRGRDIANKHIKIFSSILSQENIPVPSTSNSFVTDSIVAPFSDKLMTFYVSVLNAAGLANYGAGVVASLRKDLQTTYLRLSTEIGQYVDDGSKIMINNGWLEQPPQVINHENLTHV